MTKAERIQRLLAAIPGLSSYRLHLVDKVVGFFQTPKTFSRNRKKALCAVHGTKVSKVSPIKMFTA